MIIKLKTTQQRQLDFSHPWWCRNLFFEKFDFCKNLKDGLIIIYSERGKINIKETIEKLLYELSLNFELLCALVLILVRSPFPGS